MQVKHSEVSKMQ